MSGSADLYRRLKNRDIMIDGSGPLGGWEDNYITPGGTHECHPDFVATPIGNNPNGFLVCQRKKTQISNVIPQSKYRLTNSTVTVNKVQTHDLYTNDPLVEPRRTSQPLEMKDRRLPHQAHYQGTDYYRDPVLYRGIGVENLERDIGQFGYRENKYFFSRSPPVYDVTFAVQPFALWKREQLRMKNLTIEQIDKIEKDSFVSNSAVF